ncbi:MAG: AMP-binding protein [Muribaculaceae bacterium]|nr:AMP-binding protein [Muribaculaceae bacterium]MDE6320742.1 AMP-binding protein [Muribaculaceae bacterium]
MILIDPENRAQQFVNEWNNGDPYILVHTSGSTGKPKEIKLLKSDMLISARATCEFFHLNSKSVLVSPLSIDYIAGKMVVVRGIEANCIVIFERPSNQPLHSIKGYEHVDLLPIVPSQAQWIIDNAHTLPDIQNVIVGGAPMSPKIESGLKSLNINAWATYGMTEACSHVALRPLGDTTFYALPHITFDTTDDNRLIINSSLMSWQQLITNDVVELISPSQFIWLGRADNVINSGGVKLHPEIIEQELAPYIPHTFYVRGIADDQLGSALQLVVEDPEGHLNTTALIESLKSSGAIHPYHIPRSVITLPTLPRTSSGKIIRSK